MLKFFATRLFLPPVFCAFQFVRCLLKKLFATGLFLRRFVTSIRIGKESAEKSRKSWLTFPLLTNLRIYLMSRRQR